MLRVDVDGGIATVALDRPEKRNALSIELRDRITAVLAELADDEAVRVIVLTGRGEVFCAGFDLGEFTAAAVDADLEARLWESSDRFHRAVLECPTPTVAAVNGPALAGGFDLAVMCDVRIAATTARFAHPEITFGDVVYGPLHDIVGGGIARELVLTGRSVDAAEALSLHLVAAVVEPDDLPAAARELAATVAATPREVGRRTKAKIIRRAAITTGPTLDL